MSHKWSNSSLFRGVACDLFGAKPLPEPVLTNFLWSHEEQNSAQFKTKYKHFVKENVFQNGVCQISAILFRPQCVKMVMTLVNLYLLFDLLLHLSHDDVIKWKHFHVTGPLWWISLIKASDAELWCFLWSAPEQTVEQTIGTPAIWDAIAFIMTKL